MARAREKLMQGPGYTGSSGERVEGGSPNQMSRRKTLYPVYERWCRQLGIILVVSGRRFSPDPTYALDDMGFEVVKTRRKYEFYLEGVVLTPNVFEFDYCVGAPVNSPSPPYGGDEKKPEQYPRPVPNLNDSCAFRSLFIQLFNPCIRARN